MTDSPEKLSLDSMDVSAAKRAELRQLFPEVFTESTDAKGVLSEAIDFEKLQAVLGETGELLDQRKERYGLEWPGKRECHRAIQTPSRATLKPSRDESVEFDATENVFIEGDNLEVLKLLQKAYYGKVKMIYIDPPYNTGKDFIYPDNYSESLDTYLKYTGQADEEGRKFTTNTKDSGRFHSQWLNMMYPRLYVARNLLREDGFCVISCDDSELTNLTQLLREIFGEENEIGVLIWDRNRKNDARYLSVGHEYMLIVAKNERFLSEKETKLRVLKPGFREAGKLFDKLRKKHKNDWKKVQEDFRNFYNALPKSDPRKSLGRYSKVDESGPFRDDGNINWPGGGGPEYEVLHPVTHRPCKIPNSGWRYPNPDRFWEEVENGHVVFGEDETTVPSIRTNLFEKPDQVLQSVHFSYAQSASQEFDGLFEGKRVFDNPKNFRDLAMLVDYLTVDGDIVVDFFAGSASSGHGVFEADYEGEHSRKFLLVQLPETLPMKGVAATNARDLGFETIADVAKERLKLAGNTYRLAPDELALEDQKKLDLGFRVFKLAPSNFATWDGSNTEIDPAALAKQLEAHIDHVDPSASEEDLLYEILIKAGYPLTTPVDKRELAGRTVYSIQDGALLICLAREIDTGLIKAIADAAPFQFICLDSAFGGDDPLKTNAVQTFRTRPSGGDEGILFRTV